MRSLTRLTFTLAAIFIMGCASQNLVRSTFASQEITGVTQVLIGLIDQQDKTTLAAEDYQATSLSQLITLGTPAGYRLKLRYLKFGISLVEALKVAKDPLLRQRLIEEVQWARKPEVRAEAIVTLASLGQPAHKKYFKEAVLDGKVGIRFAAIEALQSWKQPESLDLLKLAMGRDSSPLVQVFAAQAILSLGDESGMAILYKGLDNNSWVVRAMAARYLGDYGKPDDYTLLVSYLNRESRNDFVAAEMAIAALKLISKKGEKAFYSPVSAGWKQNEEVAYTLGKDNAIELEPLVIIPPRLRIPASLQIAAEINQRLLDMMKNKLSVELDKIQDQDPIKLELNQMVTPTGFALKTRYSELSYLVIEGLAGTNDPLLRMELQRMAQDSTNPLVRASTLISLAYSRDPSDLYLIQKGISDQNAIVRMGAMEAIEAGRFRDALPALNGIMIGDPSPALRVFAMQVLAKFGDSSGRMSMLSYLTNPDWPARAMAFWYLGRYGDPSDYSLLVSHLPSETNPFVQAEICLSILRLAPVEDQ